MDIQKIFLVKKEQLQTAVKDAFVEEIFWTVDNKTKRIKKTEDDFYFAIMEGENIREETIIIEKEFEKMKKLFGKIISRIKYLINLADNSVTELNVYKRNRKELITATIKFESKAHAKNFIPPQWFGKEVKKGPKFKQTFFEL